MRYLLGIDQGGTKTTALVGDDKGNILGMGNSFGAVHSTHGLDRAMEAMKTACDEALCQAGINYGDIYGFFGGVSGIDWDYEKDLMEEAVRDKFAIARVKIVNDCMIAMRAQTDAKRCAVICAGTGVNCAVKNGEQEVIFGYYIPDNLQGGAAIGANALQRVFDAEAGVGDKTIMTDMVLKLFSLASTDSLLKKYVEKDLDEKKCSRLPMLVEDAALRGDMVAEQVYVDFAKGIVPYVHAGMDKLGILTEETDVVLSGSIFKCRSKGLRDTVRSCILEKAPRANIFDAVYEPIIGAYMMGLDEISDVDFYEIHRNIKKGEAIFKILRNYRRVL